MIGLDQCILRNPATSPYNPLPMASDIFHPPLQSQFYFPSFVIGKILFMTFMRRLKIQRVKIVPPIPTTTIVIPKVQLSITKYLQLNLKPRLLYHPEKGISIIK